MRCARHSVGCEPDGRCAICARQDRATAWFGGAALRGLATAGAFLVVGGLGYRLGGVRSATEAAASDITPIATSAAVPLAIPLEKKALRAAADPALDRRLREFQEAFTNVWRAGLEDTATGTEVEPAGGTAPTTAEPPAATSVSTASSVATANADASAATAAAATATTAAIASSQPPTAIATATSTTTASAALPIASATSVTTAIASAEPPTKTRDEPAGTASAQLVAGATTPAVATDAGPHDIRVVVYTASWCVACQMAKAWMTGHHVAFEERDVGAFPEYAAELLLLSPLRTIPTFDVDGDVMVGFSPRRLVAMIQKAALRQGEAGAL